MESGEKFEEAQKCPEIISALEGYELYKDGTEYERIGAACRAYFRSVIEHRAEEVLHHVFRGMASSLWTHKMEPQAGEPVLAWFASGYEQGQWLEGRVIAGEFVRPDGQKIKMGTDDDRCCGKRYGFITHMLPFSSLPMF